MSAVTLTNSTKILDLVKEYPFLLDVLIEFDSKLKLLKNPLMRNTIGRRATLMDVSRTADLDLDKLVRLIQKSIEENSGNEVSIDDLVDERTELLKSIVKDLHRGEDQEKLREKFNATLGDVDASEIAAMEQSLIDAGELTSAEITALCDIHVGIFNDSLVKQLSVDTVPGHPLHNYRKENEIAQSLLKTLRKEPTEENLKRLSEIQTHYVRLQNQLFPALERVGFNAPTQVMWAKQDEIRDLFKEGMPRLDDILTEVEEMIYKEEKILFPTSIDLLAPEDWELVGRGEEEIGYSWIQPEKPMVLSMMPATPEETSTEEGSAEDDRIELRTGNLTPEQIDLMLRNLPVEMSFIDENDEVKYYSDHDHRIFPRSPGAIGRKVQNCHPQKSVSTVNKILQSFKDGSKDVAEFWIPFIGRLIHIRYFPLRDEEGNYRGTIEVTQDITDIQKLRGEQRLLSWES